jgi:hypothetical protein
MTAMESTTTTESAIARTRALWHVWSECPQAVTRRLADHMAPVQGTTLPTSGTAGLAQHVAVPETGLKGIALSTTFRARTAVSDNYMDVPPFRPGRPPV